MSFILGCCFRSSCCVCFSVDIVVVVSFFAGVDFVVFFVVLFGVSFFGGCCFFFVVVVLFSFFTSRSGCLLLNFSISSFALDNIGFSGLFSLGFIFASSSSIVCLFLGVVVVIVVFLLSFVVCFPFVVGCFCFGIVPVGLLTIVDVLFVSKLFSNLFSNNAFSPFNFFFSIFRFCSRLSGEDVLLHWSCSPRDVGQVGDVLGLGGDEELLVDGLEESSSTGLVPPDVTGGVFVAVLPGPGDGVLAEGEPRDVGEVGSEELLEFGPFGPSGTGLVPPVSSRR